MKKPNSKSWLAAFTVLLTLPQTFSQAQEANTPWYKHNIRNAWLQNHDPTLISPRLRTELSYQDLSDDQSTLKLETTLRWATGIGDDWAFGLQAMLPLVREQAPTDSENYFGNIEIRAGMVKKISDSLRYGIALNAAFDTASSETKDNPSVKLKPICAIRWDLSEKANTGIQLEYTFTPHDEGDQDAKTLELKLPIALKFSDSWSGSLTYKPQWNFTTDSTRHRVSADTSYTLGQEHQYALSLGVELPLSEQDLDWKCIAGLTWYF